MISPQLDPENNFFVRTYPQVALLPELVIPRRLEVNNERVRGETDKKAQEILAYIPPEKPNRIISSEKMPEEIENLSQEVNRFKNRALEAEKTLMAARLDSALPIDTLRQKAYECLKQIFTLIEEFSKALEANTDPLPVLDREKITNFLSEISNLINYLNRSSVQLHKIEDVKGVKINNWLVYSLKLADAYLVWLSKACRIHNTLHLLLKTIKNFNTTFENFSVINHTYLQNESLTDILHEIEKNTSIDQNLVNLVFNSKERILVINEVSKLQQVHIQIGSGEHNKIDFKKFNNYLQTSFRDLYKLQENLDKKFTLKFTFAKENLSFTLSPRVIYDRFINELNEFWRIFNNMYFKFQIYGISLKIIQPLVLITQMHQKLSDELQTVTKLETNQITPGQTSSINKDLYQKFVFKFSCILKLWVELQETCLKKFEYCNLNMQLNEASAVQISLDKINSLIQWISFTPPTPPNESRVPLTDQDKLIKGFTDKLRVRHLVDTVFLLDWIEPVATGKESKLAAWTYFHTFRAWSGPNAVKFVEVVESLRNGNRSSKSGAFP